jgi:excisionase family DNA binding protein
MSVELLADHVYTTDEAAEVLGVHIDTLRKYLREGKLYAANAYSGGPRKRRIMGSQLIRFIETGSGVKNSI